MRARILVFAALVTGCFSEAPGGTDCPVGGKGCSCTAGGACDPGLECHAESQNCYDPECDEGSLDCPCFDGMCFADLMCIDGYCEARGEGSSGGQGSEGSSSASSSASSTDPTVADDGGGSTSSATVADSGQTQSTNPTIAEAGDTGIPDELCRQCFVEHASMECSAALGMCMGGMGCSATYGCVEGGDQFFECCGLIEDGASLWNELASCIDENACAIECSTTITTCV